MSEMVERVLAAIRSCQYVGDQGQSEIDLVNDGEAIARAAIKSMREPTDRMIEAGDGATTLDSLPDVFLAQWQAAIDEALR